MAAAANRAWGIAIAIAAAVALWVIGEGPLARIGALLIGAVALGLVLRKVGSRGRR